MNNTSTKTNRDTDDGERRLLEDYFTAAERGDVETVKLHHEVGLDVNVQQERTLFTAIHIAIGMSREALFDYLIELPNINLAIQDKWGRTPIDLAEMSKNARFFLRRIDDVLDAGLPQEPPSP